MKYFINTRLDNTRYRLAEGFLLFFGTPLVRQKINYQESRYPSSFKLQDKNSKHFLNSADI